MQSFSSESKERRRNRFANPSTSIVNKKENETDKPFIGTCQTLEKSYFRLTSVGFFLFDFENLLILLLLLLKAANPSIVRPLAILEQAFEFVMNKYKLNNDWSYISSQLKSIRQDLMVQTIRNDFTVLVYEENARLALEMVFI